MGGAAASVEREEESLRRHLAAPLLMPGPLFALQEGLEKASVEGGVEDVATMLAGVRGGQLASLAARQQLLRHLATSLPARAAAAKRDLADLRCAGGATSAKAVSLHERA